MRRRPGTASALCACPICGRQYSSDIIVEHADQCAVRQERKLGGGSMRSGAFTVESRGGGQFIRAGGCYTVSLTVPCARTHMLLRARRPIRA